MVSGLIFENLQILAAHPGTIFILSELRMNHLGGCVFSHLDAPSSKHLLI